jgi:hypothetical protein
VAWTIFSTTLINLENKGKNDTNMRKYWNFLDSKDFCELLVQKSSSKIQNFVKKLKFSHIFGSVSLSTVVNYKYCKTKENTGRKSIKNAF